MPHVPCFILFCETWLGHGLVLVAEDSRKTAGLERVD